MNLANVAQWTILVAFVQPFVLNFILQSGWSDKVQTLVALAFSVVSGGLTAYFTGALHGLDTVGVILAVFGAGIAFYKGFWKNVAPNMKSKLDFAKAA